MKNKEISLEIKASKLEEKNAPFSLAEQKYTLYIIPKRNLAAVS